MQTAFRKFSVVVKCIHDNIIVATPCNACVCVCMCVAPSPAVIYIVSYKSTRDAE